MVRKIAVLLCVIVFSVYPAIVISQHLQVEGNLTEEEQTEEGNYTEVPPEPFEEIIIPESGVKRNVEGQLKGTGLIFMPYAPGEAFPVEEGHRYTSVKPVIILPENNANKTEVKEGGKNDE